MSARLLDQRKQIGLIHQLAGDRYSDWSVGSVNSHQLSSTGPADCANILWSQDEWFGRIRRRKPGLAEWYVFLGEVLSVSRRLVISGRARFTRRLPA